MSSARWIVGGAVATAVAVAAAVVLWPSDRRVPREQSRWRTVTILKSRNEIAPGGSLPAPLAELGDAIEVRMVDAPAGRGTELSARLTAGDPEGQAVVRRLRGDDPRQDVRIALRQAKALIEVGELTRQTPQPAGRRKPTPQAALGELLAVRAAGEGVL